MSFLLTIWWSAVGLAAGALAAMGWLIALRVRRARVQAADALLKKRVVRAMTALVAGDESASEALAAFRGHSRLLTETTLDFADMIRGADRERLRDRLTAMGHDGRLRRDLARGKPDARIRAAEALAMFPGPLTVEVLETALTDREPAVSLAALRTLALLEAAPPLASLLKNGEGAWGGSRLFAEILVLIARTRAGEIRALSADPNLPTGLHMTLLETLGAAGDYAALPLLCDAAGSSRSEVRATAVRALGALAHPSADPVLQLALVDAQHEVRGAAVAAVARAGLHKLVGDVQLRLSDEVWWVRHEAAEALAQMGAAGLAALEAAAACAHPAARRSAGLALAVRSAA